jgi:hypothetical protein
MMATFARKWLWEKSAFVLAACVLCGLIAGIMLPPSSPALPSWAFAQIIMAIVVLIRESMRLIHE